MVKESKNTSHQSETDELKPWDRQMRWLFGIEPEDLVAWLMHDQAEFLGLVNTELYGRSVSSDMLCRVRVKGDRAMLHIAFQKSCDPTIAEYLWEQTTVFKQVCKRLHCERIEQGRVKTLRIAHRERLGRFGLRFVGSFL